MDTVEAIRVIALRDVLMGGSSYNLRFLHRWFSKTFSTPLQDVYALDINELLQAFFEEKYESMDEDEREQARQDLLESEEEKQTKISQRDADRAAEEELVKMSQTQNVAGVPLAGVAPPVNLEGLHDPVKLSSLPELPQNVKMDFVDDQEFEALLEGGFANQTKKREPII